MRMGKSYVCIGNNSSDPKATGNQCTPAFYDGGFKTTVTLPAGRYVFIFRDGGSVENYYNIAEVGLYGLPNLVKTATIITTYTPVSNTLGPNNLKMNLENRSHSYLAPPLKAFNTPDTSINSCFVVQTASPFTGSYVLGVDHG